MWWLFAPTLTLKDILIISGLFLVIFLTLFTIVRLNKKSDGPKDKK